jgi:hypothetical protein
MSTLTELLPAGGSGKTIDFVASGTLANGQTVILQADGTVKAVAVVSTAVSENIPSGSQTTFESNTTDYISASFDPNNDKKFVIAYQGSNYGKAVIGTISGTSISFGTPVTFSSYSTYYIGVDFDPNTSGNLVVSYQRQSTTYCYCKVGTVSGTSITFGSEYTANSASSYFTAITFDPTTANRFVVAYRDYGGSDYGRARVGTVSGTSISFGTEAQFVTSYALGISLDFDHNTTGSFAVVYRHQSGTGYGTICIGNISGTSITFGSEYNFNSSSTYLGVNAIKFDPNTSNKAVVAYQDVGNSSYGTARVCTISGTSVSFGTEYVFNSSSSDDTTIDFDPNTSNKFIVAFKDIGNGNKATAVVGTVSSTSISFGSIYRVKDATTTNPYVIFDTQNAGECVFCYRASTESNYGKAIMGQMATTISATNLTATNLIGTSTDAYADAATSTIMLKGGISTSQSGLTIGSDYYVQNNGTLSTTAASPSVKLGKAITATTVLLSGE